MRLILQVLAWGAFSAATLFVWAYVVLWAFFAFGAEWFGGLLFALAFTVGGFVLVRRHV